MSKPRIIIMETAEGISITSDQEVEVTFLDGFTEGLEEEELVEINGDQYQFSSNFDVTISPREVEEIEEQIRQHNDPVCSDCEHFDRYDVEQDEDQEHGGCWKQHGTVHENAPASSCEDFSRGKEW